VHGRNYNDGFTLIEIIVLIVFVSIALVGVLSAYKHAMTTAADPLHNTRALKLGQALLEEIIAKRFDENSGQGGVPPCNSAGAPACSGVLGTDPGEVFRYQYDDVDDYHGMDLLPPTDINDNVLTGYAAYRVQVAVGNAGTELVDLGAADAKRIDVIVTTPRGYDFTFSAYRVNF
jgi:MSHA pilin protein MshD